GQRPAGTIIRNVGPGQQIATVIRHPTTGNWVHAPGQINPQQQQQIILQQQSQGQGQGPPLQGQQVRVSGPVSHLLQHKPQGGGAAGGQTFTWNAGGVSPQQSGSQSVDGGGPPGGVVQQVTSGVPGGGGTLDQQQLLQLKQRQQMAKLLQQQQLVMEQTQAANQQLTTPDLVSTHPGSDLNDVSAAGQLRLMTAHHQAQLQPPHPPTSAQLYQSAPPGSVVSGAGVGGPQQVLSQQPQPQQQVTPPRVSQQLVTSSRSAGHYGSSSGGHSAALRVAQVLAKSAAGQSVSAQHQQQLAHQQRAQFYGHNPNIKLPPEKCLLGCVFLIVEYDKHPEESHQVDTWIQIIQQNGGEVESSYVLRLTHILCLSQKHPLVQQNGGEVESSYVLRLTHILCLSQKHPLVQQGLRDGKRCITAHWLNDVITRQHVLPPHLAIHFPTPYRLEGAKVKKAKEIQRPIVNAQWLNEVMFGHYACIQQADNQKYQQYNLSHPFRIDYSLVLHLMGPWKAPINVSQEAYDRAKAAGAAQGGPRRKKQKTSHPSGVGGENEDVENSEIPALTLEPLPYENKPRILLSGFAKPLEEEKKVKQLGADMAVSWRDATHLVLANPAQGRTLKFLCALSRVRHIVSGAWLRACLQASHLVDEAEYEVKEIVVSAPDDNDNIKTEPDKEEDPAAAGPDAASQPVPGSGTKRVVCNVPAVLRTGEARARLFAGKTFYLSPSIAPSPGAMRKMIEAAGGSVERQRRSWSKIQDGGLGGEGPSYLVITCRADLHLVADLLKHDYRK
ncbi:hypothetical protein M8J76_014385, partial [Diaphorina citri]